MSCNISQIVTERIVCAKTCTVRFNDVPVAILGFTGTTLSNESEYYDGGVTTSREVRWTIYVDNFLIYDFGYGNYGDNVAELGNGSIYNEMNLGVNNQDILAFIESLPNTIVPEGTKFTMYLDVTDNTGVMSVNESNIFTFSK